MFPRTRRRAAATSASDRRIAAAISHVRSRCLRHRCSWISISSRCAPGQGLIALLPFPTALAKTLHPPLQQRTAFLRSDPTQKLDRLFLQLDAVGEEGFNFLAAFFAQIADIVDLHVLVIVL